MSPETRRQKMESYGKGYETLVAGLRPYPQEMWSFRDQHGCWSIQEHVAHITDSEANSYIRCRRLIAEPGKPLMPYDENAWATALNYPAQDPRMCIELFRLLRHHTYTLIKTLPESAWSNTCHHPENGDMTLDDWLTVYETHIPEHLQSCQENYDAWLQTRP